MTTTSPKKFHLHFIKSINEVDPAAWNNLAGDSYPFLQYEFFLALEESHCTNAQTGWQPFHVIVEAQQDNQENEVIAIMPLFLKTNSTGEYVFDWSWADAYQQHGIPYYPKFVTSIPFTPATGPRICVAPNYDYTKICSLITKQVLEQAFELNISSWHLLFPEKTLSGILETQDIQQRIGCQYQWFNNDFHSFDHFLEKFSSRKRKNIKKERSKIEEADIKFEILEGREIKAKHWQFFYSFYQSTYFVRGRHPYLTDQFFTNIGEKIPDSLLLVMALKDGEYIAGALSFKGEDTLYGRYWGCTEEYQFLHFETCYYQGIEYCIKHGFKRFDSGAQGEHKIQRGFEPVLTYSNHWIAHPQFNKAIATFLKEEESYIQDYIVRVEKALPFKQS